MMRERKKWERKKEMKEREGKKLRMKNYVWWRNDDDDEADDQTRNGN